MAASSSVLLIEPTGDHYWQRAGKAWHALPEGEAPPAGALRIVTNLPDENIVDIEVPRLFGNDRKAFIARQLATRFPDTIYRGSQPVAGSGWQERFAPGHEVLYGIAPQRIEAALQTHPRPLAGIWPASLLLARIGGQRSLPAILFVILPGPEHLRIVFLKQHRPLLTRLAPVPADPALQAEEIVRTRRYLENTHHLERGEIVYPVLFLGPTEALAAPLAAARLALVPPPGGNAGDGRLQLLDLALRNPPGQVAPVAQRAEWLAGRLRTAATATGILAVGGAALATHGAVTSLFEARAQRDAARLASAETQGRIDAVAARIAEYRVDPALVRRAVALDDAEIERAPALDTTLAPLAAAVAALPGARIRQLEWRLADTPGTSCTLDPTSAATPTVPADPGAAPAGPVLNIGFELSLPESLQPGARARALAELSRRLAAIPGARLTADPARSLGQTALTGGAAAPAERQLIWCVTLPVASGPNPEPAA